MSLIAWIVISFIILQLIVAMINLVTGTELPQAEDKIPLVSVLIPARNEECNIGNILDDLATNDYRNIEIMVYDDHSDDSTAKIVKAHSLTDSRIGLIATYDLPAGWLGKNFACHTLASAATGDFLLFLDADVRIGRGAVSRAVSYAKRNSLALVSIFPKQVMLSLGERMTVPVMNFILLSLLPLVLVKMSLRKSLAAANGQFMLFDSNAYRKKLPHEKMKIEKVEDIAIARYLKSSGYRISCHTGDDSVRCHMYNSFSDAVNGFSKNVAAFFGNSLSIAFLFWLLTSAGILAVTISMHIYLTIAVIMILILTRVIVSITSRQSVLYNILLLIPQQIALGLFIYFAFINKYFRKYKWKGRDIY